MPYNASVAQFAQGLQRARLAMVGASKEEMKEKADRLAEIMRQNVSDDPTLSSSVRVVQANGGLTVSVQAGGAETTIPIANPRGVNNEYDYALAREFGTQHIPAHPFFYAAYYAAKPAILSGIANGILVAGLAAWAGAR